MKLGQRNPQNKPSKKESSTSPGGRNNAPKPSTAKADAEEQNSDNNAVQTKVKSPKNNPNDPGIQTS